MNCSKKILKFNFAGNRLVMQCETAHEINVAREVISKILEQAVEPKKQAVKRGGTREE